MRYSVPIKIITVDHQGFHIMLTGKVNNYNMHLLIDTGATLTVLDINRVRKIFPGKEFETYTKFFMGIGASDIKTFSTIIDELYLGDFLIREKMAVLIDMSEINKAYAAFDLPRVDGVIGGDILHSYKAVIDYKNSVLELEDSI